MIISILTVPTACDHFLSITPAHLLSSLSVQSPPLESTLGLIPSSQSVQSLTQGRMIKALLSAQHTLPAPHLSLFPVLLPPTAVLYPSPLPFFLLDYRWGLGHTINVATLGGTESKPYAKDGPVVDAAWAQEPSDPL